MAELAPGGRIVGFVEKPAQAVPGRLANSGVCLFEPLVLTIVRRGQVADFGSDVIPALVARGLPVYGEFSRGYILDIGSAERYAEAQADFASGRFISPLDGSDLLTRKAC